MEISFVNFKMVSGPDVKANLKIEFLKNNLLK